MLSVLSKVPYADPIPFFLTEMFDGAERRRKYIGIPNFFPISPWSIYYAVCLYKWEW